MGLRKSLLTVFKTEETHLPAPPHIYLPSPPTALGGSSYKYLTAQETHGTQSMGF